MFVLGPYQLKLIFLWRLALSSFQGGLDTGRISTDGYVSLFFMLRNFVQVEINVCQDFQFFSYLLLLFYLLLFDQLYFFLA